MTAGSAALLAKEWSRFTLDLAGDTLTVTLNQAESRNSVDVTLMAELISLSAGLAPCTDIRFVVFDHEGPVFSSGADVSSVVSILEGEPDEVISGLQVQQRLGQEMVRAIEGIGQVTICKIRGGAYGAGATIMIATDFRVMASDAVFNLPESRVGVFLSFGCTPRVVAAVGALKAKEMIMLAEDVSADECVRLGLANAVADGDAMDAWVDRVIATLRRRGRLAVDITKKMVGASAVPTGSNIQFLEAHLMERVADSGELLEGFKKVMNR